MKLHPAQKVEDIHGLISEAHEETKVQVINFDGVKEIQSVTVPATASAAQGDYFIMEDTAGVKHAFWIDIDADATEPTGAAYVASDEQHIISIVSLATAAANAAIVKTAIDASAAFGSTSLTNATVSVTQLLSGNVTAPARHNTGDTGNGSFTVATVLGGSLPTLNSKYFTFDKNGTSYYAWFNVNGGGVDPAPGGTGVEVEATGEETAAELAALAAAEITGLSGITCVAEDTVLHIVVDAIGDIENATAGNSGLSVIIQVQGTDGLLSPGGNEATTSPVTTIIDPLT